MDRRVQQHGRQIPKRQPAQNDRLAVKSPSAARKTDGCTIACHHHGAPLEGGCVVPVQCDEMVRRIETGAGVGLLYNELTAVLVTDQEQHCLSRRYPPAVSRRYDEVSSSDGKQCCASAGIEALKLSSEYTPAGHLYRQRNDLPPVIEHGEHSAIGDDQPLLVLRAAAGPLDAHAHYGVPPGLDGCWQCGRRQIGVGHNLRRRAFCWVGDGSSV